MSNSISSVSSTRPIGREVTSSDITTKAAELSNIKTTDALKKAELTGLRISVGDEQTVKRIDRALKALQGPSTNFEVSVHEQTKAVMIKIFNSDTGELIREVPPEKTLDIVAKLLEINGLLIDEKV